MTNREKELIVMKLREINNNITDLIAIISYAEGSTNNEEKIKPNTTENEQLLANEKTLENEIRNIIAELGVRYANAGFKYIIEGVSYLCSKQNEKDYTKISMTKELYPHIAKKFNSTPSRVERAIRHEVSCIHTRGNIEKYTQIFPFWDLQKDNITNSNFLFGLAYFISKKKSSVA